MILAFALLGCEPDGAVVFERDVVPVLEARCASAACHGVGPGAEAAGEQIDWSLLYFRLDADGRIADLGAAREAALRTITTSEAPELSSLVRKPLASSYGGLPHYGGVSFASPADASYQAILEWIALEAAGGEDEPPLDAREQAFADDVQPFLVGAGCMSGPCHGAATGVPLQFDPGVGGVIGYAATRKNVAAARTMITLDGHPELSRLVRKGLPLHEGGIVHKGGNRTFLTGRDDPRLGPILDWVCGEREANVGAPCEEAPTIGVRGLVFVRGPVAPEDPFDAEAFLPGTDLWLATLDANGAVVAEENLTAALHASPADVRDPAVDPAGGTIAFALREAGDAGHGIVVLDLATREARRVTAPVQGTDRDPTFGPDGTVWFASTRAHESADGGRLDADLWSVDLVTGAVTRRTHTPHIERKPVFLYGGHETAGTVTFTALRDTYEGVRRGHPFRFPPGLHTEYHQQFGMTSAEDLLTDLRELPDGRYLLLASDLDARWGGRPAILDRNFGPELGSGTPSVPFYAPPLVRLDPDASVSGVTGRVWRDPAPLPDGRFVAATADGPLDLAGAEAPDYAIARVTIGEAPDGSGPVITGRTVLIDTPGVAEYDPEPVFARAPPPSTPTRWDPDAPTAVLRHQGFPVIDALLRNLPPGGPRLPREDFVAVRVIEAVPIPPEAFSSRTLGHVLPGRVLAEVPLEADGTFLAEVPAGTSVRLQGLDARGVAVGTPHNRWFDVHGGQVVPQGVSADVYGTTCAVCHGALDGRPEDLVPDIDALTSASLTLARYDQQDPRRPRPAVMCTREASRPSTFVDLRAIIEARCTSCHAGGDDLDLSSTPAGAFDVGYAGLWARGLVGTTSADSPLATRLLDGHGALSDEERRAFLRWIDAGGAWSLP